MRATLDTTVTSSDKTPITVFFFNKSQRVYVIVITHCVYDIVYKLTNRQKTDQYRANDNNILHACAVVLYTLRFDSTAFRPRYEHSTTYVTKRRRLWVAAWRPK